MTQGIITNNLKEVLNNKERLRKELGIKITNKGRIILIEGAPENEYLGLKILEAVNLGFSIEKALLLKDEEVIFHVINIKDITRRKDLVHIRARIIGTEGKTKKNIENLSDCLVSMHNNQVGIIGEAGCIEEAIIAMKSLIQGSKQGNVYARLER